MITTIKEFKKGKSVILGVDYCQYPHLFGRVLHRVGYWSNVYGWRADFFDVGLGLGVVTGYDLKGATLHVWDLNAEFYDQLVDFEREAREWRGDQAEAQAMIKALAQLLRRVEQGDFVKVYNGYYNGNLWATGRTKAELRKDFYNNRDDLVIFYCLDKLPKYSDLTIISE